MILRSQTVYWVVRANPLGRQALLLLFALVVLAACGGSAASSNPTPTPTPDSLTLRYIALVHKYWIAYKTAEGDLDHLSGTSYAPFGADDLPRVCFGYPSPRMPRDLGVVDPAKCGRLSTAIVVVHEQFLSDLGATPAPVKFASDDQVFRNQLPKAIADVKSMISASSSGSKEAVVQATTSYVHDMIPAVTDALDDVDPSFVHN